MSRRLDTGYWEVCPGDLILVTGRCVQGIWHWLLGGVSRRFDWLLGGVSRRFDIALLGGVSTRLETGYSEMCPGDSNKH